MLKIQYFTCCIVAMILWACSAKQSDSNDSPELSIKIMTYNIHHANPPSRPDEIDIEAIAEVIRKESPDLVALQEVDVFTKRSGVPLHEARALAQKLDMNYYFAKALDYQGGFYGNAVLSKVPIKDSLRIALPTLPDVDAENRVWAGIKVNIEGKDMWFGSTHLDFSSEKNNLHQSNTLLAGIKDISIPVIIGGDFNATASSPTLGLFGQQFERTCPGDCPPTSPADNPVKTIDFLMYRPKDGFSTISHEVIQEDYASDHLPVVAELRFE